MKLKELMQTITSQLVVISEHKNEVLCSEKESPYRRIYAGYSSAIDTELDNYLERKVSAVSANKDIFGMIFKNAKNEAYLSIILK